MAGVTGPTSYQLMVQRNSLVSQRNNLSERLEQLKTIRNNLQTGLEDEVSQANRDMNSAINDLKNGLSGSTSVHAVISDYNTYLQKPLSCDSNMSTCLSFVQYEINRCENEIDQFNSAIRSQDAAIQNAKAAEAAAQASN